MRTTRYGFYGNKGPREVPNKAHQKLKSVVMELDAGDRETGSVLESALIDQRMRADRHRANFESLKAQHLTLQEVKFLWSMAIVQLPYTVFDYLIAMLLCTK